LFRDATMFCEGCDEPTMKEHRELKAEVARLLAQDKETFTDAVALLNERDEARADAADAREKLADWENAEKHVAADWPDEKHCGCVPVLRKWLEDSRKGERQSRRFARLFRKQRDRLCVQRDRWRECADMLAFAVRTALREEGTILNWRAFAADGLAEFDKLKGETR